MANNVTLDPGSGGAIITAVDLTTFAAYPSTGELPASCLYLSTIVGSAPTPLCNANPMPVGDGGGSLTVDGTVAFSNSTIAVTNAGTFAVQATLAAETTKVIGTVNVAAGQTIAVTGTFWQATQPVSLASVPSHAVTNAGTFATQIDGAALTALQLIDDAVSGAGFNITQMNGVNVTMGNGASGTGVQRVTIANDCTGIIALTTSTASIGKLASNTGVTIGAVEIAAAQTLATVTTVGTVTAVTAITNALPAGTNAIGKLAANSGVDIGDVDVTSVPADPFGVNADAGSATGSISAKLRFIAATGIPITGTVTVGSHAVTNAGTFAVQESGTQVQVDDAAFTPATSKIVMVGLQADETATDSVDEGDGGCPRMTLDRKQIVNPQPHTTGGLTPYSLISTGTSGDATNVKASAGQLYEIVVSNINASPCYLKLYDSASAPTAGSGTPKLRLLVPGNTAGSGLAKTFPLGIAFASGIGFTVVTTAPDAGSTGVAANEVLINLGYK